MTRNSKTFVKLLMVCLSMALLLPTLAACAKKSGNEPEQERVLRIVAMDANPDNDYFKSQYTDTFQITHKNIQIELVPVMDYNKYRYQMPEPGEKPEDPMENFKAILAGDNPPDVVIMSYEQLDGLIQENLLQPLDPLMTKDNFNVDDFVPAVIDGIKKLSPDNKLYALAPTFSSSALVYNKKLFDDKKIPYPTDQMTWDEIFNKARQLSSGTEDDRTYGFSFNMYTWSDPFYDMQSYTMPLEMRYFDDVNMKMTVDSDQWEQAWTLFADLYSQKVIPGLPDQSGGIARPMPMDTGETEWNPFQDNRFLSSKVAMTIIGYSDINQIIDANKNALNVKGFTPIDWDVVTVPVHSSNPTVGGSMYMNPIVGINANAQNQPDAWEFVKFINGEDWASLKSSSSYNLVSRKKYIQQKDGLVYNTPAFYTLTPAPVDDVYNITQQYPYFDVWSLQNIGRQLFTQVINGEIEVRAALQQWQTQGDAMIKQMLENPNQPPDFNVYSSEKAMIKQAAGDY